MTEDMDNFDFFGRPSLSFQDFGRESLGILPPNYGRESLGILNISSTISRDCLSGLQTPDFGQDSIEYGRESLGILNQSIFDNNFGDELNTAFYFQSPRTGMFSLLDNKDRTVKIKLTTIKESSDVVSTKTVDTAFLFPSPQRPILSSASSQNSGVSSFNSSSLEGPSKIYNLSRSQCMFPSYTDFDSSFVNSDLNKARLIISSENVEPRARINSMPNSGACENFNNNHCKKFWSTGKTSSMENLLRTDLASEKLDFDDEKEGNFHDSVFIEGSYIARKMADGSIFNDSNVLESTNQPSWPSDLDESKTNEKEVVNTETVFKKIDKLLPDHLHTSDGKLKSQQSQSGLNDPKDVKGILQNLSEILNNSNRSDKERSHGQNLLSSLAEMLHGSSHPTSPNLDDSGHSSFVEQNESPPEQEKHYHTPDDSNKVSEEDLSKIESSENNMSLSSTVDVKQPSNRRLSQSFCAPTLTIKVSKPDVKLRNSSVGGLESVKNESVNSNLSSKSNNSHGSAINLLSTKFKSKSTSVMNRGPLKAVIPVKDMRRKGSSIAVTPEHSQQSTAILLNSKRTSTPINEPKIKPVAASTPSFQNRDNKQAKGNNRKSLPGNISMEFPPEQYRRQATPTINRKTLPSSASTQVASEISKYHQESRNHRKSLPNSLTKNIPASKPKKVNDLPKYPRSPVSYSANTAKTKISSVKSESISTTKPTRRNSVSENLFKCSPKLKRSNSLGKETGIMSSLSKVRDSLLKSPYFQDERKLLLENNHSRLKKMESDISGAVSKTLSRSKISNKENAN